MKYVYVAMGGAIGTILRFLIASFFTTKVNTFPFGTFLVNLSGSFLIGFIAGFCLDKLEVDGRLFLISGVLGGYTTFSSFALEALNLLKNQQTTLAFLYVTGSTILGVLLAAIGFIIGNAIQQKLRVNP